MALTPPQVAAALKNSLSPSMGRRLFAVVGPYPRLADVEACLQQLGLPPSIPVTAEILKALPPSELDHLQQFEGVARQAIRKSLQAGYGHLLRQHLESANVLVLRDFELLFQVGVDLQVVQNLAVGNKSIVLLIPGRTHQEQVYAYADETFEGISFFPGLLEPAHVWTTE